MIGTNPRFSFCCGNGCGECDVKRIELEYSREETMDGRLIESETTPILVSRCCGHPLMVYDNDKDEEVTINLAAF